MSMLLSIYTHICVCIDTLLVFYRSEVSALLLGFILHVCSDALCIVSFSEGAVYCFLYARCMDWVFSLFVCLGLHSLQLQSYAVSSYS